MVPLSELGITLPTYAAWMVIGFIATMPCSLNDLQWLRSFLSRRTYLSMRKGRPPAVILADLNAGLAVVRASG
jgi:hypothetical protein